MMKKKLYIYIYIYILVKKNQKKVFGEINPQHQILTLHQILEIVRAKNLEATTLFVDFSKAFDSIHRAKME